MKEYYQSNRDTVKPNDDHGTIIYEGKIIDECPFCGAVIEIEISICHWGGE